MSKKPEKKPIYRTISDRTAGQFIVNIANVPEGKLELYKLTNNGQSVPIADLELPENMRINPDPKEFRQHIQKEIRKIQSYVTAKNEFLKSGIALKIDETSAIQEGLIEPGEDKRRLKESENTKSGKKKSKKEEAKMGRPGFFKGVTFDRD